MTKPQLTKSEYMLYLRHPAWLWIKKFDKNKLPPISAELQAMFDTGHDFEQYAEAHFPDGVNLGFDDYNGYLNLPARTKQALDDGAKTIFQGRFESGQLTFICDVIRVVGERQLDLYEIKSSTSVKDDHILDLAFQATVLEGCNYSVRNIYVMYVNNSYIKQGKIDYRQLVTNEDVTEAVKAELGDTQRNIKGALAVLDQKEMPDPSPSHAKLNSYSDWLEVYKNIVAVPDGSIYELCGLNASTVGLLEQNGITKLAEVPEALVSKASQRRQLQALKDGKIVDLNKIQEFLSGLEYPLYFFDYETFSSCVPHFDNTKPYQQLPFQYSLHILGEPSGKLEHFEYLHTSSEAPFQPLSKALQDQIGNRGSIVTWNMSFEKNCNSRLGKLAPEYAEFYQKLNNRIVDLKLPFSQGSYVDAGFKGSASLKSVLPVLAPELSYKELGIQEGGTAQRTWMGAILRGEANGAEREQIIDDLLKYCHLDTLAMVRIYEFLLNLIRTDGLGSHEADQLSLI